MRKPSIRRAISTRGHCVRAFRSFKPVVALRSAFLVLLLTGLGQQTGASELDPTLSSADVYGDLRVRAEFDDKPNARDRWRPRLRLRLGSNFSLGEEFRIGVRVTTGNPSDPRSPHQTFGEGGGKFVISLDRAFLDYAPQQIDGLRLTAGKFGHRFRRPAVYGEVALDADMQPSGFLATYQTGTRPQLFLGAGEYLADESSGSDDSHAFVGQAAVRHVSESGVEITVAADALLLFIGDATVDKLGHPSGRGNAVVGSRFASDFRIFQGFANLTIPVQEEPLTLSGGYLVNSEAATEDDFAWFVGARLGQVSSRGDWRLFAQYQQVEQEAVFTPWAQDDFPDDRGSRYKGVVGGLELGVHKSITLRLWTLASSLLDAQASEDDSWLVRYRLDCNASF